MRALMSCTQQTKMESLSVMNFVKADEQVSYLSFAQRFVADLKRSAVLATGSSNKTINFNLSDQNVLNDLEQNGL